MFYEREGGSHMTEAIDMIQAGAIGLFVILIVLLKYPR